MENLIGVESAAELFSFVLNAVILIFIMLFARVDLKRLKRLLDILDNGGWRNCPKLIDYAQKGGKRDYDHMFYPENSSKEGGENYG